jgi:hypothetical protein
LLYRTDSRGGEVVSPLGWIILSLGALVGIFLLFIVLGFGWNAYSRYQERQNRNQARQQALYDAHNKTTLNSIRISQQQQLVKVAKQQADIRYQDAVGVRRAQDEIQSTLSPLYVQFEYIRAMEDIAKTGRNSSVIFIPTGPDGRPVVTQQMNPTNPTGK